MFQRLAELDFRIGTRLQTNKTRRIGLAMPTARPAQWMHEGFRCLIGTDNLGCQGASFVEPRMVCGISCRLYEAPVQMKLCLEAPCLVLPRPATRNDGCRFA